MNATLLLNATFEPMKVIPWQRAITLLFLGKAELVEQYDVVVRSVNDALPMPSVVRLRRYARQERRVTFSRLNVYRRDGFACQYCGAQPSASALTLDHVTPRSRGGATSWTNVVACCSSCNAKKADRTPDEARMTLARKPERPHSMPLVSAAEHKHPRWGDYLG